MRKFGFYPKLAARSLRLNGKFYLPYLLSGVVSAAMLYDILFLTSPSPSSATPTASL